MREVTIVEEVYTYNELSKEAKDKVKEWYLEGQEPEIYEEMILEKIGDLFPNSDLKVQFRLSNCQGDGVNIYGKLKIEDLFPHMEDTNYKTLFTEEDLSILKKYFSILKVNEDFDSFSLPINFKYNYCKISQINFEEELIFLLKDYINDNDIDKCLLHKFSIFVKIFIKDLCEEFEKDGYNYFYEISEGDLKEVCDSNNYEFYKDGTLYL